MAKHDFKYAKDDLDLYRLLHGPYAAPVLSRYRMRKKPKVEMVDYGV